MGDKEEFVKYLESVIPEFIEISNSINKYGSDPKIYITQNILSVKYSVSVLDIEPWIPGEITIGDERVIEKYYQDFRIEKRNNIINKILG